MDKLIGLRRMLVASWAMINLMVLAFMTLYAKPEAIGAISLCIGGVITVTGFFFGERALGNRKDTSEVKPLVDKVV